MNPFDIAICLGLAAFMGLGFYAGLLRTLASILGYVVASPIAIAATSSISPALAGDATPVWARNFVLFFVVLLAVGGVIAHFMRHGVKELFGEQVDMAQALVRVTGLALAGQLPRVERRADCARRAARLHRRHHPADVADVGRADAAGEWRVERHDLVAQHLARLDLQPVAAMGGGD